MVPAVGWKLGTWHDLRWWALRLLEPSTAPTEPRAWDGAID